MGDTDYFESIFDQSNDGILVVDPGANVIVDANPRACELLGYSRDGLLATRPSDLHPHEVSKFEAFVTSVECGGHGWTDELSCRSRSGALVPVEISASVIDIADQQRLLVLLRDVRALRAAQAVIDRSERRFRALLEGAPDAVVVVDASGRIVLVNRQTRSLFGYRNDDLVGQPLEILLPRRFHSAHLEHRAAFAQDPRVRSMGSGGDYRGIRKDGSELVVDVSLSPVEADEGRLVVAFVRDITEQRMAEEALRTSESKYRDLFESAYDIVVMLDGAGDILDANARTESLTGYGRAELRTLNVLRDLVVPDDRELIQGVLQDVAKGVGRRYEVRWLAKDGSVLVLEGGTTSNIEATGDLLWTRCTLRDISDRKELEAELAHRAFHDSLTGLPNRALLRDHLEHALARARRHDVGLALLFLDIDNFKTVNDTLGHATGDALLASVAERLRTCVRPGDTVARLGGDEFALLLEETADPTTIAQRVLDSFVSPFRVQESELEVSASVGIAVPDSADASAHELLRAADLAMYAAKSGGKHTYAVFDPGMGRSFESRVTLESELRAALRSGKGGLVYYQPIVDLATSRIVAVEALVRWQHPTRGLLEPTEFIGVAEETGLIVDLGRWVLQSACRQSRRWQSDLGADAPLRVGVNVSARQLAEPNVVEMVVDELAASRLDPQALALEITESILIDQEAVASRVLASLRDLGVSIAIDDFGTGYASLSYLQRFAVDIIKVDKLFIDGLLGGPERSAVVRAIIELGRTLGLRTVAEGVENAEQAATLRSLGANFAQGYYFSRPLTPKAMTSLLRRQPPLPVELSEHA